MALSDYDISQLTSVYGIGRAEALALGEDLNALVAGTLSTLTEPAQRALRQLVSQAVAGGAEARDAIAAINAAAVEPGATDQDVVNLFTLRLPGLSKDALSVVVDAIYSITATYDTDSVGDYLTDSNGDYLVG